MDKLVPVDLTDSFFDFVWRVFGNYAEYALIIGLSFLSSLAILYLFKWFSNQEKIKYHKRRIMGYILQLRLYQDRLSIIASSVLQILKHNALYIRYTLPSLMLIVIPVFLVCAVINARCGYEPLKGGERLIVEIGLNSSQQESVLFNDVKCIVSDGISLETLPLRILSQERILWRARMQKDVEKGNDEFIIIAVGNKTVHKKVLTESNGRRFSPILAAFDAKSALLYSGEGFIEKNSPVDFVSLTIERKSLPFLFWKLDPILVYFIITMVFAFSLKNAIKVSI